MGEQLSESQHYGIEGFKGGLQLSTYYAKRRRFLGLPMYFFYSPQGASIAAVSELQHQLGVFIAI